VRGAKPVLDLVVVAGALIGVSNQQTDGRTGGFALKDTGKDLHLIRLSALRGIAALARLAPIQIAL